MDKKYLLNFPITQNTKLNSKNDILDFLAADIKESEVGYAGFAEREYLRNTLETFVFDKDQDIISFDFSMPQKLIESAAEKILTTCEHILSSSETTQVFFFPTFSKFVQEKMGGVSGLTPYKNTMLIFIHVFNFTPQSLEYNLSHEYLHTISYQYAQPITLLDNIVAEGLAEHFSEKVTHYMSPISHSNSQNVIHDNISKISKHLGSEDQSLIKNVILGYENYPVWIGYSIGYSLIKQYMEINPSIDLGNIIRENPATIVNATNFFK